MLYKFDFRIYGWIYHNIDIENKSMTIRVLSGTLTTGNSMKICFVIAVHKIILTIIPHK